MEVDQDMLKTEPLVAVETSPATEPLVGQNVPAPTEDANPKKRPREDDDEASDEDGGGDDHGDHPAHSPRASVDAAGPDQPKLSKNQLRKQKRQKLREERRGERKQMRKDKRHEKTARRRQEREEKAEEIAQKEGIDKAEALKRVLAEEQAERKTAPRSRPVPVAFIIDCDFEKYMHENELVSLASQITRSYSMNKTGLYQGHLLVSSWGGKLGERFNTVLKGTHLNWKGVSFVDGDFVEAGKVAWGIMNGPAAGKACPALGGEELTSVDDEDTREKPAREADDQAITEPQVAGGEVTSGETLPAGEFSTDSVVYLSADSPFTLDKLEPNTSYVVGGLVDRNREKNLCQRRAEEKGIRTAKLPIGEYMQMASRRVLATNHVVEIMSKWLETGDWAKAFMEVIPKRKGGQLKSTEEDDEDAGEAEGSGGDEAADAEHAEGAHANGTTNMEAQ